MPKLSDAVPVRVDNERTGDDAVGRVMPEFGDVKSQVNAREVEKEFPAASLAIRNEV